MFAVTDKYFKLIERFPLQPITSSEDLAAALELSLELHLAYKDLADDELGYLSILSDAIEKFENAIVSVGKTKITPVEMLNWLLETNDLTQSDLAEILDVSRGRASEVCNGVRPLSKSHIQALSARFGVSTDLFFETVPTDKSNQKSKPTPTPRRTTASVVELRKKERRVGAKAMKASSSKTKSKKDNRTATRPGRK